jgi:hypothetical protein
MISDQDKTLAKHIMTAFVLISNANHYMVGFVRVNTTIEQLELAKQFLIVRANNGEEKEVMERALDLIELEIKGWKI